QHAVTEFLCFFDEIHGRALLRCANENVDLKRPVELRQIDVLDVLEVDQKTPSCHLYSPKEVRQGTLGGHRAGVSGGIIGIVPSLDKHNCGAIAAATTCRGSLTAAVVIVLTSHWPSTLDGKGDGPWRRRRRESLPMRTMTWGS